MHRSVDGPESPAEGSDFQVDASQADILVVDDDVKNLLAMEVALGDLAGGMVRAQSGPEALRILLERNFALVLLDVQMPDMDGYETARFIRQRRSSQHTPIIFVTAHSRDDQEVLKAYELGAVDFLYKPIVAEVLRAKANVFVALQQRTAEVARQAAMLRMHEKRAYDQERQRWEAETLRERNHQLADADRRKDEFLAMLGHELRTPLAPILTGLEVLSRRIAGRTDLGNAAATCDVVSRQLRHLVSLVDDLLDISRINAGKIALRKQPVRVDVLIEQAVAAAKPLLDERKHELRVTVPPALPAIHADSVRITQVLSNLLTNAARYTDPGGVIRLDCATRDGIVELRVTDNGRGIPPAMLSRVFDMFVQEKDTAHEGGLGLGLALVKRLVDLHHGTVACRSDGSGRGSEFVVHLPVAEAAVPERVTAALVVPKPEATRSLRLVLVEDNADIRETFRELLLMLGHTVELAADGQEGVELILRTKPDVAFVDIGLPVLDGYEVARAVRAQLGPRECRMIAMTGFGQDSDRRQAIDAGFDRHLVKPADVETIEEVLLPGSER